MCAFEMVKTILLNKTDLKMAKHDCSLVLAILTIFIDT